MIGVAKLTAGPGGVELAERPEARPGPGQVAIAVAASGVCGTDLHIEAGEYEAAAPVTLGHEIAGTVAAVGPGGDASLVGERVVTETFYSTCGACRSCQAGRVNLCSHRRSIGTHVDGGFAARVVVPAHNLHRVPDGLGLYAAALAEPLACVCQCLLDPHVVGPGDRVLVVGPGPMGALAAQVARACGGDVVVAGLARDRERLALLERLGIATVLAEDAGEADIAIEASGSASGAQVAIASVRRGGALVQMGLFGQDVELPADQVVMKEMTVRTGFASTPVSWRRALALMRAGGLQLDPLVSEVAPLPDFARVFGDLRAGRGMKILLAPDGQG